MIAPPATAATLTGAAAAAAEDATMGASSDSLEFGMATGAGAVLAPKSLAMGAAARGAASGACAGWGEAAFFGEGALPFLAEGGDK